MKKSFAMLLAVAVLLSAATFSACDSSTRYINVMSEISGETYRINRMEQKKAYEAGGMGKHFYTKLSPVEVARKLEGQAEKVEAYGNKLLLTYDLGGGKKDFLVVNSIAKTTDSGNEYFVRSAVASKSSQKNDHSFVIYYLFPLHFLADFACQKGCGRKKTQTKRRNRRAKQACFFGRYLQPAFHRRNQRA